LGLAPAKVAAACALFDEGATLPFVARYRKERTGGLDEVALRAIVEHRRRLAELDKRRQAIRAALTEQGQLTPELARRLDAATTRAALEDLYAPFKKRRKTRGDLARERGLAPLAEQIRAQPRGPRAPRPRQAAQAFVSAARGVSDVDAALAGARDIVAEELGLHAGLRAFVREQVDRHAKVKATAVKAARERAASDPGLRRRLDELTARAEPARKIPSHRYLALCRAEDEGLVRVRVRPDVERTVRQVLDGSSYDRRSPFAGELEAAVEDATKRLLLPAAERAARAALKARADDEAIDVFERNLEALLLAAPLGAEPVLALDPGLRTGTKWVALDATGAPHGDGGHGVLYLVGRGEEQTAAAVERLAALLRRYRPRAVAVGNGTAGREALAAARRAVERAGLGGQTLVVSVNEAGASVYSASELAGAELPGLDVTIRGAVSIGRRLQDPLAELVKIDPKSLGVGQYQHDVDQGKLTRRLHAVAESCVNRVGVDLNTASPSLLAYVAGVGPKLARAIVDVRTSRARGGRGFQSRRELLQVPGLGPKTFEQCAGFLRVRGGSNPLDASAVHPERYELVQRMARELKLDASGPPGVPVEDLIGDAALVDRIDLARYRDEPGGPGRGAGVGLATLRDIVDELKRPGRDPRVAFEAPAFRDDVREVGDLEVGMVLEGVVTNVTDFGAFVDIGVHRDGLVHVSQLAEGFVRSPHDVVRPGQPLRVQVTAVDRDRDRISLTARLTPA